MPWAPAIAALSPDRIVSSDLTRAAADGRERRAGVRHPASSWTRASARSTSGAWQGLTAAEVAERWPEEQAAAAARRGRAARRRTASRWPTSPTASGAALDELLDDLRAGASASSSSTHGASGRTAVAVAARPRPRASPGGCSAALGNCHWAELVEGRAGWRHPDVERLVRGGLASRVLAALRPIWSGPGGAWVNSPSPLRGTPTRGCSAVGSAPPWHGGGQGFESPQLHRRTKGRRQPALRRRWARGLVRLGHGSTAAVRTCVGADVVPAQAGQTPLEPRRCEPSRWVSTMPTASMSAYIVVGPTNTNPLRLSAFDRASDSGEVVGTSAYVARPRGVGRPEGPDERRQVALGVLAQAPAWPGRW